jgi:hypothetical protein
MKQTTMQFDKRKNVPVTLKRLQEVVDLVSDGMILNHALRQVSLKGSMGKYLVSARILARLDGRTVVVLKPKLERKDFYRVMELQKRYHQQRYENKKLVTGYNQLPKADTDMLGLVNMPSTEPIKLQRTPKQRAKKAVALPWWKRFLLYLLNH